MRERRRAETVDIGGNFHLRHRSCNREPGLLSHAIITVIHVFRTNYYLINYLDEHEFNIYIYI